MSSTSKPPSNSASSATAKSRPKGRLILLVVVFGPLLMLALILWLGSMQRGQRVDAGNPPASDQ